MISIRVSQQQEGKNLMLIPEDNNGGGRKNTVVFPFFSREIPDIMGMSHGEKGEPGKGDRFGIRLPAEKYRFLKPEMYDGGIDRAGSGGRELCGQSAHIAVQ